MPPAPGRLKTWTLPVMSSSSMTLAAARAVVSYPPPGELGTMNCRPVAARGPAGAGGSRRCLRGPAAGEASVAATTAPRAMR